MKKKTLAIVALAAMMAIAGCQSGDITTGGDISMDKYPIETDETLTYWCAVSTNISSQVENLGDTQYAKELEKRTGIHVEYTHPIASQTKESLGLMIASGELPDIIETNWISYAGGPAKAMDEEVIIDIAEYKDYAPNFFKFITEREDYDKASKTDDGRYYGFTTINDGNKLLVPIGPIARMDWLRDLGMETPTTIDEWTEMLRAFRDQKGATAPLSFNYGSISSVMGLFEAKWDPYVKDGKIVYGPVQPEFKKALETLNAWFEEGLLDKNIASVDDKVLNNQVLTGKTGATVAPGGSGIGQYMSIMKDKDPTFDFAGIPYPTYEKGKITNMVPIMTPVNGDAAAITTKAKNPALAAKFLDYVYSDEGHMFANFGIEGETYTIQDGEPVYTDLITKNPDGLSMAQALGQFVKAGSGKAFVQDERYILQYYGIPQQQAALNNWNIGAEESSKIISPALTLTSEETSEYALIINDVTKYRNQMVVKFITGLEPIDKFDEYVETMNQKGLDRAMEIRTAAYLRHNSK